MTKLLPSDCLDLLANEFGLNGQAEIANFLGLTQPRVSQIKSSANLTKTHVKTLLKRAFEAGRQKGRGDVNTKLLSSFGKMRNLTIQEELATALKKTQGAVAQWKSGRLQISDQTIESILKKSAHLTIHRLVEMEEVDPGQPGASHWYFYNSKKNIERKRLLRKLEQKRGIYFYLGMSAALLELSSGSIVI